MRGLLMEECVHDNAHVCHKADVQSSPISVHISRTGVGATQWYKQLIGWTRLRRMQCRLSGCQSIRRLLRPPRCSKCVGTCKSHHRDMSASASLPLT